MENGLYGWNIVVVHIFPVASPETQNPSQPENGPYECMQNLSSLSGKSTSPSHPEWKGDASTAPCITPVCPVPLTAGDSPSYRSPFNKTNCRFSVMTSYTPYHQGLYTGTQEQAARPLPYTVGHPFGAEHPASCYHYMPGELYPGNFLKGQDCLPNGYISLPVSNQNGGAAAVVSSNTTLDFGS